MASFVQIVVNRKSGQHTFINALLAIITGILTLVYPQFLYMIAGAYLIVTGLVFFFFNFNTFLTAVTILAGILIYIFPNFIPYTFAFFLLILGITTAMSGGLSFIGIISILLAVLLLSVPGSIAYFIAAFMLLYGIKNVLDLIQASRNQ